MAQLELMSGSVSKLTKKCVEDALAGDEKARDFIGKYLLGGGKVSLDDLYNPPLIKKRRS